MSWACDLYVSNKIHARYRHVKYASNAFGACFGHDSVRYMRVPILLDITSVACLKRVERLLRACIACLGRNTSVL